MSEYAYYRREFLNSEANGGIALLEANVDKDASWGVHANLTLGDCNRQIHLDFSCHNEDSYRHMLEKFNKIEAALSQLRAKAQQMALDNLEKWKENARKREEARKQHEANATEPETLIRRPRRRRVANAATRRRRNRA